MLLTAAGRDYLAQVRAFNPHEALTAYPGSPCLARALMRPQDQLRLYELHPTDHTLLAEAFAGDRTVQVQHADGFGGIKAQLPPPSRRGLLLMDPSYELKTDYAAVAAAVTRTPTGHPEGYLEAFASLYSEIAQHLRAARPGRKSARPDKACHFPTIADGLRGVQFIEAVQRSSRQGGRWIKLPQNVV